MLEKPVLPQWLETVVIVIDRKKIKVHSIPQVYMVCKKRKGP